jgi:hypothetical protein
MQQDPVAQTTRDLIVEAAFLSLAEASLEDLMSFVGPTSLARASKGLIEAERRVGVRPPAPETVAYHFHTPGTSRQFDLGTLADELIEQACSQTVEAAEDARQTYLAAAEHFAASHKFEAVIAAVDADLEHYRPGSADALVDARERVYFTAVALCDLGSSIARKLQQTNARSVDSAVPIYERFLQLTGRRMAGRFTVRELAALVAMLLEAQSLRARYKGELPIEKIAAAVIRIFWAFTVRQDAAESDVSADLVSALG